MAEQSSPHTPMPLEQPAPAAPNRFALYLKPVGVDHHACIQLVNEEQKKWGGIHATLCSFAPRSGSGALGAHSTSLKKSMKLAADAARAHSACWTLGKDAPLDVRVKKDRPCVGCSNVTLKLPKGSRTLQALTHSLQQRGLQDVRAPERLHVTLGRCEYISEETVAEVQRVLRDAHWKLVIVRGTEVGEPLRATRFNEEIALEWEPDHAAAPPGYAAVVLAVTHQDHGQCILLFLEGGGKGKGTWHHPWKI